MVDNRTVNDDLLLVIDSPLLAAHFTREMDRLLPSTDLGVTDALRRQLDQNRSTCGSGVRTAALILAVGHTQRSL